jgi:MFS transporter, DHA1 family, tetracycline resistance protein
VSATRIVRVAALVTLGMDSIGIGLVRPVAPELMSRFTPDPISDVGSVLGIWFAMFSIGLFLAAPILGHLSDHVGRRRVLLIFLLGGAIDYAIAATTTNMWVFFAARFLAGVCAGTAAVVQALITDVTPPQERAKSFAMMSTAFGFGMVIGPPIGGFLGQLSPAAPFAAAACLTFLVWVLNFFVLPETLTPDRRRALDISAFNPVKAILAIRGMGAGGLITAAMLLHFASFAAECTTVLFTQAQLGWTTVQVGFFLAAAGIVAVLTRVPLTGWSVRTLGERRTILVGLLVIAICQFLFAGVRESWQMYALIVLGIMGNAAAPTLFGALSRSVAPAQIGQFMGGLTSLQILVAGLAAPAGTALFSLFTSDRAPLHLPGAAYVVSSALIAVALLVAFVTTLPLAAPAPGPGSRQGS